MNLELIKENPKKMLLQFAIPAIIGMLLSASITLIDGYFIGNYVGKAGTAAVNLGLPLLYIYLGLGIMIGVGGIAIAGMELGRKNIKRCNNLFNQTITLTLVITLLLSVIVFILFKPVTSLLSLDTQVLSCFKQYYLIMIWAYPMMILISNLGMFMRGEGNPQLNMFINILNLILNFVLDYIFTVKMGLGIKGVAFASLISIFLCFVLSLVYFTKLSKIYKIQRFSFSKNDMKVMLFNGSSELIGELSMSISMFAYNAVILKNQGINGVAAFTIVGYLSYIFSMIIIGFGQGGSPLISFTYGAKDYQTCKKIRKLSNFYALGCGIVAVVIVFLTMNFYSTLFLKNKAIVTLVKSGIRIFIISFLFAGINTITSFYFTSIGYAKESAVISSARGLVFLLIGIFTLPYLLGMTGVWLVAPITEALTFIISIFYLKTRKLTAASTH